MDNRLSQDMEVPKLSEERDLDPETHSEEEVKWNRRLRALGLETDEAGERTIVSKLIASFAPSIFEEDEVKKGLLCQLFGGTPKPMSAKAQRSRLRCVEII